MVHMKMKTICLVRPPQRTEPLTVREKRTLQTAYQLWTSDSCYLSGSNYWVREEREERNRIAKWNKFVKSLFRDNSDFHRLAQLFRAGQFIDPTQCPQFYWSTANDGADMELMVRKGNGVGTVIAKTSSLHIPGVNLSSNPSFIAAELMMDAINHYATTTKGLKAIEALLERIDL
jgi:hypothetical protein